MSGIAEQCCSIDHHPHELKIRLAVCQGISDDQGELQMGAWAMFAAPLLMGNDVRNLTDAQQAILLNKDVIAIDQDPAGANNKCALSLNRVHGGLTAHTGF